MNIQRYTALAALIISMVCVQHVSLAAESDWNIKTNAQGIYGSYSGSLIRKSISSAGLILNADYLDAGGFALGANFTTLAFKGSPNLSQRAGYASIYYNVYQDALSGPLTLRMDAHGVYNNDISGNTDKVHVLAPQLSFLNYDKSLYVDIGYAYSSYQNNLNVHQFTPTFGFGFNALADWVRLRGYYIDPSNPLRAQNKNSTVALEVKWSHWFESGAWHRLESMHLTGLVGERIYAVDADAAVVYNLTDIQRGSVSLALQWKLTESVHVMLMLGNESYLNNATADAYNNRFGYMNISSQW